MLWNRLLCHPVCHLGKGGSTDRLACLSPGVFKSLQRCGLGIITPREVPTSLSSLGGACKGTQALLWISILLYDTQEELLRVIMHCSMESHLSLGDFSCTNRGLWTFKGLFFISWLSLCLLAECEGTKKIPVSMVTLPKEYYRTKVTFDPNTAFPWLIVSADRTYVEWGEGPQNVPDNPERFNSTPALLGLPGFTSGKHYWEVEYGDQREWAVGVALERVDRKVYLTLVPEEGIWQEGLWWLRTLGNRSHTLFQRPGIIGVFLDYEAGTVTFYINRKVILKRASFSGEKVFPFFYLGGTVHLRLIE